MATGELLEVCMLNGPGGSCQEVPDTIERGRARHLVRLLS